MLDYALLNPRALSALILNSTGYPDEVIAHAKTLSIPVLVLHGEADGASEGGTAMTAISRARRFAETLSHSGVALESAYYPGGHTALFTDSAQYNDSVRRTAEFCVVTPL